MRVGHHDDGARCVCVSEHRPAPLELNSHHVHPLEYGGPNVPENRVWICPTTHVNTHELLREIVRRHGRLTYGEALDAWPQQLSRYAFDLAHEGWRRMVAAGWTP